jgi:predicted nucleotidyltransferase
MALDLKEKIEKISRQYEISAVYVFGSRAGEIAARLRGIDSRSKPPKADIDIGVMPQRGRILSAQDRVRMANAFEDLLDADRVDLVVLPEADPFLALDIIRGEMLFCADADEQAEYELLVFRRAGDLADYARERWEQILTGAPR